MKKIYIAGLLLAGGLLIFLFGNPYYSIFATNNNPTFYLILTAFFGILAWSLKRKPAWSRYWPSAFAFFIAASTLLFLRTGVFNLPVDLLNPIRDLALNKVGQANHIIPVILMMTFLVREDLKSLYITQGDLRAGLIFGLISFVVFMIVAFVIVLLSGKIGLHLEKNIGWILLFVFTNATMEELWFRGIFLRKFEALVGRWPAILLTSIVFGASHISATYAFPGGGWVFGGVVFGLGLVSGYAMMKDESALGPILFHAGYDLLIFIPVLESVS